jgi:uncharacterized membrane protein YdjX (TVP38/TMEM64 family)
MTVTSKSNNSTRANRQLCANIYKCRCSFFLGVLILSITNDFLQLIDTVFGPKVVLHVQLSVQQVHAFRPLSSSSRVVNDHGCCENQRCRRRDYNHRHKYSSSCFHGSNSNNNHIDYIMNKIGYLRGGSSSDTSNEGDPVEFTDGEKNSLKVQSSAVSMIRSGASPSAITTIPTGQVTESKKSNSQLKHLRTTLLVSMIVVSLYSCRTVWLPWMDKAFIQEKTLSLLQSLRPSDPNDVVAWTKAMSTYIAGMAFWEFIGMSTIPVEIAAGMVFGFWKGAAASIFGKLLGASIAFGLGRTILSSWVTQSSMLQNNPVFQLLNNNSNDNKNNHVASSSRRTPLQTVFLMKFSCFPEFIKNFGSSVLPVIKPWMFLAVTLVHGGTFSLLWTWSGVDAAARLSNAALPVNRQLQITLLFAAFVGLVLTPAVMAWWINDLKQSSSSVKSNQAIG